MTGTTHRRPRPARPALNPWLVVLALAPGIFLTLADATVMSVAVPLIIRRLEGVGHLRLVGDERLQPGARRPLPDDGPARRPLRPQAAVRARPRGVHGRVASAARAPGASTTLIAWRVVQAVGAAAVVPTALALLLQAFPDAPAGLRGRPVRRAQLGRRRGRAGARRRAHRALGLAGRLLVQRPGRRARRRAGARRSSAAAACARATPLDWPGVGLVTAGLFCLTLAIIQGNDWGWTSARHPRPVRRRGRHPRRLGLVGAAHAPSPLFDLRLFRRAHVRRRERRHHDRRHRA